MRNLLTRTGYLLACSLLVLFVSCSNVNYGKKITVDGTRGEVYYKGEGVTEADAKSLGAYLKEMNFFQSDEKVRSVQLLKNKDRIEIRFVMDEKAFASYPELDHSFALSGANLSKTHFNGLPVDIFFTDNLFTEKKKIAFQPELLNVADKVGDELKAMKRLDMDDNKMFYTDNIPGNDAKRLFAYLKEKEFFTAGGHSNFIIRQLEGDSVWIRFPVKSDYANENTYKMVDEFGQQLKRDIFGTTIVRFDVTDIDLKVLKTFNY